MKCIKNILSAGFLLAAVTVVSAQSPKKLDFGENFPGIVRAIDLDPAGNAYVTGVFTGSESFGPYNLISNGETDVFLMKINASGSLNWVVGFGNDQIDDVYGIAVDNSNNVIVTGSFIGSVDFDPGSDEFIIDGQPVNTDGFVAQFDDEGSFIWAGSVSGETNEIIYGVATDDSRNIYLTGSFDGDTDLDPTSGVQTVVPSGSGIDAFFARVNADHTFGWVQTVGNASEVRGINVEVDFSGAPVFSGHYLGTLDINPGPGTQNITSSGGITFRDIFVTKLNGTTGAFTWGTSIGGNEGNFPYSMSIDGQSNIYVTGEFDGTGDFDPDVSLTKILTSQGGSDIFITKFHPSGAVLWARSFGGTGADHGLGVYANNSDVYLTGDFFDEIDFGTSGSHDVFSYGSTDAFILNLDPAGNFRWVGQMGGFDDEDALAVVGDASGNVFTIGNFFSRPADMDPGCSLLDLDAETEPWYIIKIGTTPSDCASITQQPVDADVCAGTTVLLEVETTGSILAYQWMIADADGGYQDINDAPGEYSGTNTPQLTIFTSDTHGEGLYVVQITPSSGPLFYSDEAIVIVGPHLPFVSDIVNCGPGAATFIAEGGDAGEYRWYDVPSGGTPISGQLNHTFTTPVLTTTTTYYVSINNGTCEGPRAAATVHITACEPTPGLKWAKGFGGNNTDDVGEIILLSDGNLLVPGSFMSTVDFDKNPATTSNNLTATGVDGYFMKMTPDGDILWIKQIGGTGYAAVGNATEDNVGNLYITGVFYGVNDFNPDSGAADINGGPSSQFNVFVAKYDKDGVYQWVHHFGAGTKTEGLSDVEAVGNDLFITGYFWDSFAMDGSLVPGMTSAGGTDIYVAKLSLSTGALTWIKRIGGAYSQGNVVTETSNALAIRENDLYIAARAAEGLTDVDPDAGIVNLNVVDGDGYVVKLRVDNGAYQSVFKYDSNDGSSNVTDVVLDENGNTYTSGQYLGGSVDFDPTTGTEELTNNSTSGTNAFIAKHDGSGNLIWVKEFRMVIANTVYGGDLTVLSNGDIIASGLHQGTIDVDPGPLEYLLQQGSLFINSYVVKLNKDGEFNWGFNLRRYDNVMASSAGGGTHVVSGSGEIIMTGSLQGRVDFDPSDCTYLLQAEGATDFYLWKLGTNVTNICIDKHPVNVETCADAEGVFTVSATGAPGITYQWQKKNTTTNQFEDLIDGTEYLGSQSGNLIVYTNNGAGSGTYRAVASAPGAGSKISNEATLSLSGTRPSPPSTEGASSCSDNVALTLKASGGFNGQYRWYESDTPINPSANTSGTFVTPQLTSSKTYYVAIRTEACESERVAVTAIPNAAGTPPGTTGASRCGAGTLTLAASGGVNGQFRWYSQPTGGIAIAGEVNATFVTPSITTTTTYYVSIQLTDCETPRAPVIATINSCTANQPPVIAITDASTGVGGIATIDLGPLLSDPDNNLDLTTLKIVLQPKSGAVATISNGQLSIDYSSSSFTGDDEMTIEVCDAAGSCATQVIIIHVDGDIRIFNAVSPNGDGKNDVFFIEHIDTMKSTIDNHVKIYNRWGDLVFDVKNYNNSTNVFKGNSNSGKELSSGTYFYKIEFNDRKTETGYLSLQR